MTTGAAHILRIAIDHDPDAIDKILKEIAHQEMSHGKGSSPEKTTLVLKQRLPSGIDLRCHFQIDGNADTKGTLLPSMMDGDWILDHMVIDYVNLPDTLEAKYQGKVEQGLCARQIIDLPQLEGATVMQVLTDWEMDSGGEGCKFTSFLLDHKWALETHAIENGRLVEMTRD